MSGIESPDTSLVPIPKVGAAAAGGAFGVVLVAIARAAGWDWVTPEVAAGVATLLAFAAGYLKR